MKRILWPLLLILLLCGCGTPEQIETTAPPATTQAAVEVTEPAGIYVPFSDLEIQTEGAVHCFQPATDCYGIRLMGSDVLAFCGGETTTLVRYAGDKLYAVASVRLDCRVQPEDPSFQISENGITYYDSRNRQVVFLDNDLKEVRRLDMPGEMVGKPVLSANRMLVYYCTADAVRVYDTTTGLDKLLKAVSYSRQSVEDVLLNDTVLRCSLVDDRGDAHSVFLSADTGALLYETSAVEAAVFTADDRYYASVPEGIRQLLIFGRGEEELHVLTPGDPFAESWFLTSAHSLVTASVSGEATCLDYYDLTTGLHTGSVTLPGNMVPVCVELQPDTGNVLVMAYDHMMADAPVILSWDRKAAPVVDDTIYTGPRYTADSPDIPGLEECAALAKQLGEAYDLEILIGAEAAAQQPRDYSLEMEYQTHIILAQLETLDKVLSAFPEGFFSGLYGKPRVCIVRSIQGNAESGSLESAHGVQFWSGENAYVALAAGDGLEGAFFHEMFHVMDSKILSETRAYFRWNNLNPKDFTYFEDYTSYLTANVQQYLEGEDQAFIDAYSMCYPREDRARIMEYACQPGNEDCFRSEIMQNKLRTLCEGIRAAFKLKDYPQALLWEQYLTEPLNP